MDVVCVDEEGEDVRLPPVRVALAAAPARRSAGKKGPSPKPRAPKKPKSKPDDGDGDGASDGGDGGSGGAGKKGAAKGSRRKSKNPRADGVAGLGLVLQWMKKRR